MTRMASLNDLSTRATVLASCIQSSVSKISQFLEHNGLHAFDANQCMPNQAELPAEIVEVQNSILQATDELQVLIKNPVNYVSELFGPSFLLISIHAINRYKIAQIIPIYGEVSVSDISIKCGLSKEAIRRFLRAAATLFIFKEPREDWFAHTAASKALVENAHVDDYLSLGLDLMIPAAAKTIDAMLRWPSSEDPTCTGHNLATGQQESFFNFLAHNPTRSTQFASSMAFFESSPDFEMKHIFDIYDWSALDPGTVIDIGGGSGAAMNLLVQRFPQLEALVVDTPHVIRENLNLTNTDSRVSFLAHDFLHSELNHTGTAFFLRMILHDWPDDFCIKILRNIISALRPGNRILINDICLPDFGVLTPYQERNLRAHDMAMKAIFNSKERDITMWKAMIAAADSRFHFKHMSTSPLSKLAIIELIWDP